MSLGQLTATEGYTSSFNQLWRFADSVAKTESPAGDSWYCKEQADHQEFCGLSEHCAQVNRRGALNFVAPQYAATVSAWNSSNFTGSVEDPSGQGHLPVGPSTPCLQPGWRSPRSALDMDPAQGRQMNQAPIPAHELSGDATSSFERPSRLQTSSRPDNMAEEEIIADGITRVVSRVSPPQASSREHLDGLRRPRVLRHREESGGGSGAWDDNDDEDSSGPSRPVSGGPKRAGGTGMTEAELANLDPKRVRRIIANRQSAARSKERRMKYTRDLEHKVSGLEDQVAQLRRQLAQSEEEKRVAGQHMAEQVYALQQERTTLINEVQRLTYNQNVGVNSPQHSGRQQQDNLHVQQLNPGITSFLGHAQSGGLRPYGAHKSYGTAGLVSGSRQGDSLLRSGHDEGLGRQSGDGPETAATWRETSAAGIASSRVRSHDAEFALGMMPSRPRSMDTGYGSYQGEDTSSPMSTPARLQSTLLQGSNALSPFSVLSPPLGLYPGFSPASVGLLNTPTFTSTPMPEAGRKDAAGADTGYDTVFHAFAARHASALYPAHQAVRVKEEAGSGNDYLPEHRSAEQVQRRTDYLNPREQLRIVTRNPRQGCGASSMQLAPGSAMEHDTWQLASDDQDLDRPRSLTALASAPASFSIQIAQPVKAGSQGGRPSTPPRWQVDR